MNRFDCNHLQLPIKALEGPLSTFGLKDGDEALLSAIRAHKDVIDVQTITEPVDGVGGAYLITYLEDVPEQRVYIVSHGKHTLSGEYLYTYDKMDMCIFLVDGDKSYSILFPIYIIPDAAELYCTLQSGTAYSYAEYLQTAEILTDFYGQSDYYQITSLDASTYRVTPTATPEYSDHHWLAQSFEIACTDTTIMIQILPD